MKKSILFMLLMVMAANASAVTCYLERVWVIPHALTLDDESTGKKRVEVSDWHQCYMKARSMAASLPFTSEKGFVYKNKIIPPMKAFAAIYWNFGQMQFMQEGKLYPVEGFINRYALAFDNNGKDGGPWNNVMDPVGKRIPGASMATIE